MSKYIKDGKSLRLTLLRQDNERLRNDENNKFDEITVDKQNVECYLMVCDN